jgi:hypothetical protein
VSTQCARRKGELDLEILDVIDVDIGERTIAGRREVLSGHRPMIAVVVGHGRLRMLLSYCVGCEGKLRCQGQNANRMLTQ